MTSWSSETTAISENRTAFTISNILRQPRSSSSQSGSLRTLIVVTGISGGIPTKGNLSTEYSRRIVFQTKHVFFQIIKVQFFQEGACISTINH